MVIVFKLMYLTLLTFLTCKPDIGLIFGYFDPFV